MGRERYTVNELEAQLTCLTADLYQHCGTMPVAPLERLCRRIHLIELRIYSFKGGKYGKNRERRQQ